MSDQVVEMAKKLQGQSKVARRFLEERNLRIKLVQGFRVLRDAFERAEAQGRSLNEALEAAQPLFEELEKYENGEGMEQDG